MACTRLIPVFPRHFICRFCITINDALTCYGLDDSFSNGLANALLTDLEEGTYHYSVVAFLDGIPVASIFDVFSTGKYCLLVSRWGGGGGGGGEASMRNNNTVYM